MRIYLTRFFKYRSDKNKPTIERLAFGKGFTLSVLHFPWALFDLINRCFRIVKDPYKYDSIYKEVKFTITFKF